MLKRTLRLVPSQHSESEDYEASANSKEVQIYAIRQKFFCSSLQIAKLYGKEHFNVLRDIRNLDVSKKFMASNLEAVTYKDSGNKRRPLMLLTANAFAILSCSYTGKKAMQIRERFLGAFEKLLEAQIQSKKALKAPAKPKVPSFVQFCKDMEISIAEQEENFRYTVARYIRYIIKNFPDENIFEVIDRKISSAIYGADNHPAYSLAKQLIAEVLKSLEKECV